jgi:hypothetical protein
MRCLDPSCKKQVGVKKRVCCWCQQAHCLDHRELFDGHVRECRPKWDPAVKRTSVV